ncbi:MAG: DUF86 domain-containing protein [Desulfobacterales bacterium]|jgi:uncharacterized protein YutE (UPF0331/DUF86 family)
MVDEALILRKLNELDLYRSQLKEYESITADQYSEDWKTQRIIERTLQMMIETCADIAGHIISDRGFRIPTSYAETFKVLLEEKILDRKLYAVMEKIARFRNILVHHYDKVDAEIVTAILKNDLADFTIYEQAIIKFLKTERKRMS